MASSFPSLILIVSNRSHAQRTGPVPRAALTGEAKTVKKSMGNQLRAKSDSQNRGSSLSSGINRLSFVHWLSHFWLEEINSGEGLIPTKVEVFNVLEIHFSSSQFYSERVFLFVWFGMAVFSITLQNLALNNTPLIPILHQLYSYRAAFLSGSVLLQEILLVHLKHDNTSEVKLLFQLTKMETRWKTTQLFHRLSIEINK